MTTSFAYGLCLVNVDHLTKIRVTSFLNIAGFVMVALATYYSTQPCFYVAISACVLVGISFALGEATFMGFLKVFPSYFVGYVSSGTGFAGLSGTGMLLLCQ